MDVLDTLIPRVTWRELARAVIPHTLSALQAERFATSVLGLAKTHYAGDKEVEETLKLLSIAIWIALDESDQALSGPSMNPTDLNRILDG
ncbi:hypothetical protein Q0812_02565 [Brevundimonas sp. 2R-24]|uniref:Uncharacterized protein n=1 Tax=Peiella sedimenti TaxID=3061083 RepID=A0ABT8SIE6_9CAUL|nr:hypothetical protein [Caulobacteraceae bacterium XZ-24]